MADAVFCCPAFFDVEHVPIRFALAFTLLIFDQSFYWAPARPLNTPGAAYHAVSGAGQGIPARIP